jgi:hypothetical protein
VPLVPVFPLVPVVKEAGAAGRHRAPARGALVVGLPRSRSFFPDICNEDWFYLLDAEKGLQPLAAAGEARQRPYDPFRTSDRARREEFGDVLAEGAFWLLDQGRSVAHADGAHWAEFLERRRRFIVYVPDRVKHSGIEAGERARMVTALKAAQGRLARITPDLCRDFMRAWTTDWQRWQHHFESLQTGPPRGGRAPVAHEAGQAASAVAHATPPGARRGDTARAGS